MLLGFRSLLESDNDTTGTIGVDYLYNDVDGSLLLDEDGSALYADGATLGIGTQASQSGSLTSRERFLSVVGSSQSSQTGSVVSVERFRLASAGSQPVQTAAIAAIERSIGASASSQSAQFGAILATSGAVDGSAALLTEQRAQTGALTTVVPEVLQDLRAGGSRLTQKPLAAIATTQSSQRGHIAASTNDDELVLLLAA